MGQLRHGSAAIPWTGRASARCPREARAIRVHIQRSQASIAEVSKELGINAKTIAKWRKRQTAEDQKTAPKEPRSTVVSEEEEATVVAVRRHTLLPLEFERQTNGPGNRL